MSVTYCTVITLSARQSDYFMRPATAQIENKWAIVVANNCWVGTMVLAGKR